ANDLEVAVGVPMSAVSSEVHVPRHITEVLLLVPRVIAPNRPQHAGHGPFQDEIAAFSRLQLCAGRVYNRWLHSKKWQTGAARFAGCGARQSGQHDAASFRLPPGIYDRASALADGLVVP